MTPEGQPIGWGAQAWRRHLCCVGLTGTGKTRGVIANVARQILRHHEEVGATIVDPKGDLFDDLVAYAATHLPRSQRRRVQLIDLDDPEHLCQFNFLTPPTPHADPYTTAEQLVETILSAWGIKREEYPRLFRILTMTLFSCAVEGWSMAEAVAVLSPTQTTIRAAIAEDLRARDPGYATIADQLDVLNALKHRERWEQIESALNRLQTWAASPHLRRMLSTRGPGFSVARAIEEGWVTIINAGNRHGLIAPSEKWLLLRMLTARYLQCAMTRTITPHSKHHLMWLDEWHLYNPKITRDFFYTSRSTRVSVALIAQNLAQLARDDPELVEAALSQAQTKLVFRVSPGDAEILVRYLSLPGLDLQGPEAVRYDHYTLAFFPKETTRKVVTTTKGTSITDSKAEGEGVSELATAAASGSQSHQMTDAQVMPFASITPTTITQATGTGAGAATMHGKAKGTHRSQVKGHAETVMEAKSETEVPFYEQRPFWNHTTRQFYTADDMLLREQQKLVNQQPRELTVQLPSGQVFAATTQNTPRVKTRRSRIARFVATRYAEEDHYRTTKEADAEWTSRRREPPFTPKEATHDPTPSPTKPNSRRGHRVTAVRNDDDPDEPYTTSTITPDAPTDGKDGT